MGNTKPSGKWCYIVYRIIKRGAFADDVCHIAHICFDRSEAIGEANNIGGHVLSEFLFDDEKLTDERIAFLAEERG